MTTPVADPLRQPLLANADTAGSIAIANSRASSSRRMKLTFFWKIHKPSMAAEVKRIKVRKTHLIDALSKPVTLMGSFGEVFIKRGYLTSTSPMGVTP
jgi:hypothetical protein